MISAASVTGMATNPRVGLRLRPRLGQALAAGARPRPTSLGGRRVLCMSGPNKDIYINTPLIPSTPMSDVLGVPVWLKMDALQPSGSFKLRGVTLAIKRAQEKGCRQLVSSSGGNAGLAVAYAGKQLGLPVTVVLPESTPAFIGDKLRSYGAQVRVEGSQWSEANDVAEALVAEDQGNSLLIHPFDMKDLVFGKVEEVAAELGSPPGAFVASVGGGGLLMGVLTGLDTVGWGDVPVVATETVGADCLAQSLAAGEEVVLPGITSVAKSLGSPYPSKDLFARCQEKGPDLVRSWVCSDAAAVNACARFAQDHRVLVEPACGAALAAVYEGSKALAGVSSVVVEVCGGAIVTPETLAQQQQEVCG